MITRLRRTNFVEECTFPETTNFNVTSDSFNLPGLPQDIRRQKIGELNF